MKKFLLSSAIAVTFALFSACGDDSSSGPEEIESSSSVEAEDESSSSVEDESSSSEDMEESSSSEEEIESSSEEESSSSDVIASSSSAKQSSSSAVSFPEGVKEPGYYDCNIYNCVMTDYLKSGITYGEILDTRDNQVYKVVTIGTQTWMAQNLNYAPDAEYMSGMGEYAWSGCYGEGGYDYASESNLTDAQVADNCSKYGRLYTWEVAMNDASCAFDKVCKAPLNPTTPVQGICPDGWHLPSHGEFETLINYIDPSFGYGHTDDASSSTAGQYLKSQSGRYGSGNGYDTYGFSALPAGGRYNDGDFDYEGHYAYFWSSSEYSDYDAYNLNLYYNLDRVELYWDYKNFARSVRCLKD